MQHIFISGKLIRDAERRTISTGKNFTWLVVSCCGQKGNRTTSYYDVIYRDDPDLIQYLKKGQEVIVRGELETYLTESNGTKYMRLCVYCEKLELATTPKSHKVFQFKEINFE